MPTGRAMRVGGLTAHLESTEPAFEAALDLWLRPDAESSAGGTTDIRVRMSVASPPLPSRPPDRTQAQLRLWQQGPSVVVTDGISSGCADLAAGSIEVFAPEATVDACWGALHRSARILLGVVLAHRARFGVHAGAVAVAGRAVLILGESGAGKSTFTTHLVEQGGTLLADDSVYVAHPPLTVSGWPERTRLRGATDAPVLADGKSALAPGRSDAGDHEPALLVLLGQGHPSHPRPTPVAPADVMAYLLQASNFGLEPAVEAARIGALAALATVPAVGLPARPKLPTLPEVAAWIEA